MRELLRPDQLQARLYETTGSHAYDLFSIAFCLEERGVVADSPRETLRLERWASEKGWLLDPQRFDYLPRENYYPVVRLPELLARYETRLTPKAVEQMLWADAWWEYIVVNAAALELPHDTNTTVNDGYKAFVADVKRHLTLEPPRPDRLAPHAAQGAYSLPMEKALRASVIRATDDLRQVIHLLLDETGNARALSDDDIRTVRRITRPYAKRPSDPQR